MPPAARIGDMHVCPMVTPGTPPIPHVGGPISMGFPMVCLLRALATCASVLVRRMLSRQGCRRC